MGGAEGPFGDNRVVGGEGPGDRMDFGRLNRLFKGEVGQNRREPPRQHALPRAGRPDQQGVVPAGRRDLQRPLGHRLPQHVRHVGIAPFGGRPEIQRLFRPEGNKPLKEVHHLQRRPHPVDLNPFHDARLGGVVRREENPLKPLFRRHNRHRQRPGHPPDRPVQRQLPEEDRPRKVGHGAAGRPEQRKVDRQVVNRPGLVQVGGGEVDGDFGRRDLKPGVFQGRLHPVAALLDGGVRQPHHLEPRQPPRQIGLHLD